MSFDLPEVRMMDKGEIGQRRQAVHDIRSSLRAIGIYSDLLTTQARSKDIDLAQIDRLAEKIATSVEELADRIDSYDADLLP